jgi:hypothetical protein
VKCIAWNFDGSNIVDWLREKKEDLKKLRYENGDIILNLESYFHFWLNEDLIEI